MYKDDRGYVNMRLQGTVVRDRRVGKLTYIKEVSWSEDGLQAVAVGLIEGANYSVGLDDLDLSSPPLGNVVFRGSVYYVSRQPKREDWRQGLRSENLSSTRKGKTRKWNLPDLGVLDAPIFNHYPSYKDCVGLIASGYAKEGAFGRIFSLDNGKNVWYKQRMKVGKDKDGVPTLRKNFSWLQEALDDELKD